MNQMQALIGRTLNNRFELIEIIGTGGMSVVFRALDLRLQEMGEIYPFIALKILKPSFQADPRFYNLLAQEAKRAQSLNHPNIINVFDFDRSDDLLFMTMELLQGESLQALMQQQALPELISDRKIIALQIVSAIIYAHQHGIVHADLKPSNIFIRQSDDESQEKLNAKLSYSTTIFDFGISRALKNSSQSFVGCSPAYATPQTASGHMAGPYDDAYGLGCVLYCLFQGKHPFDLVPSNEVESASRNLQTVAGLNHAVWENLKRLLVFPFYPDAFHVVNHDDQIAQAQQQVISWEEDLRDSLLPKKRVSLQLKVALIFFICLGLFLIVNRVWNDQLALRQLERMHEQIQQQAWVELLGSIEKYKQEFNQKPLITEQDYKQFLTGLGYSAQQLMDSNSPTYDPIQAKHFLSRALVLFPDSDTLASSLLKYEQTLIQSRNLLQESLIQAIDTNHICMDLIELCRDGMTYFAQLLSNSHAAIFERLKPGLLQGYVRTFALAVYRKQFAKASRIQSDAQLFFSKATLSSLGMLDLVHDINVDGHSWTDTSVDQASKINHFQAIDHLGSFLQGVSPQTQSQWSKIFGYLASFQALAPTYDPDWRFFPLEGDFQSALTVNGKDIRTGSSQAAQSRVPNKPDPCQISPGAEHMSISCQDIYNGGSGPLMRSVWLDHPHYIAAPYRIAIAQYELSWGDVTLFCQSNDCKISGTHFEQPVFHLSEQLLDGFLDWLSDKTGYRYRLLKLEEWRSLADPLGLMNELVLNSSDYPIATCDDMGYAPQGTFLAQASVFQGSYDRYGIYNLKDLSPEVVVVGAQYILVPGRLERLRRCRIAASAYEYPFAAYRLARIVADFGPVSEAVNLQ